MPRLKQATFLVYKHLKNSLEPYGYKLIKETIKFQKYEKYLIVFYLYVDEFGVKYW